MLYTVTSTLPPVHGGRTKSLLKRIKFLEEKLNKSSTILTTNYNPNYKKVYDKFKQQGIITENLKIDNIYDWLADYKLLEKPKTKSLLHRGPKETAVKIPGLTSKVKGNTVNYYQHEQHVMTRKYYKHSNVMKTEELLATETKVKIQRKDYTVNGKLHRIVTYNPKNTFKLKEQYYEKKGTLYLEKHFSNDQENKLFQIIYYPKHKSRRVFNTEKEMFTYYFNHVLSDGSVVFNDARLLDRSLIQCENNIKRILVLHSNHLEHGKIRKSYGLALENSASIYKYLVLTHYQKADIQQQFNISDDKIEVIPHFQHQLLTEPSEKVDDYFCFIGRIAKEKQLDHLIHAFQQYLAKGYNSQLHIYGEDVDNQVSSLKDLTTELGICDNVVFNTHTNQPERVFQHATASLLTTQYEGFGMTIMESIHNGCPVVSYDVRYGPSELIIDGENGLLIDAGDVTAFANGIEKVRNIKREDVKLSEKFSEAAAVKNYQKLIQEISN
ncbi:glycosyltransferase [Staphylococcus lugdunensis]|uniref:Glycosyltransferase n=1 Tax=Staphylococcus lugdunensis TaxID=28035 RepID=A0A4Q9W9X0_STALU|nr:MULTISPECIES: glycosyltransferase [Staphylococcus]ARJ12181.1 poly(glycerol-phosphate) alpha-glucosyltransferase [Staphylococcus lugdunensis]AST59368.1 poly(glycerol-phosphate) alpha-glucosyltransferase [Staphylococcus lugdunensis]ATG69606.1 poly(glycerol-phosphate) alpha-glucosyltransferase [Staphylococcus lugdunensis]ATN14854.1 poly(glycerol-phosphate) alpha-glucosyltransferase [Staphylococcus lugdunensis]EHS02935.1 PF09318 domain protein [Staphylococcus lugdunensis VCU139]